MSPSEHSEKNDQDKSVLSALAPVFAPTNGLPTPPQHVTSTSTPEGEAGATGASESADVVEAEKPQKKKRHRAGRKRNKNKRRAAGDGQGGDGPGEPPTEDDHEEDADDEDADEEDDTIILTSPVREGKEPAASQPEMQSQSHEDTTGLINISLDQAVQQNIDPRPRTCPVCRKRHVPSSANTCRASPTRRASSLETITSLHHVDEERGAPVSPPLTSAFSASSDEDDSGVQDAAVGPIVPYSSPSGRVWADEDEDEIDPDWADSATRRMSNGDFTGDAIPARAPTRRNVHGEGAIEQPQAASTSTSDVFVESGAVSTPHKKEADHASPLRIMQGIPPIRTKPIPSETGTFDSPKSAKSTSTYSDSSSVESATGLTFKELKYRFVYTYTKLDDARETFVKENRHDSNAMNIFPGSQEYEKNLLIRKIALLALKYRKLVKDQDHNADLQQQVASMKLRIGRQSELLRLGDEEKAQSKADIEDLEDHTRHVEAQNDEFRTMFEKARKASAAGEKQDTEEPLSLSPEVLGQIGRLVTEWLSKNDEHRDPSPSRRSPDLVFAEVTQNGFHYRALVAALEENGYQFRPDHLAHEIGEVLLENNVYSIDVLLMARQLKSLDRRSMQRILKDLDSNWENAVQEQSNLNQYYQRSLEGIQSDAMIQREQLEQLDEQLFKQQEAMDQILRESEAQKASLEQRLVAMQESLEESQKASADCQRSKTELEDTLREVTDQMDSTEATACANCVVLQGKLDHECPKCTEHEARVEELGERLSGYIAENMELHQQVNKLVSQAGESTVSATTCALPSLETSASTTGATSLKQPGETAEHHSPRPVWSGSWRDYERSLRSSDTFKNTLARLKQEREPVRKREDDINALRRRAYAQQFGWQGGIPVVDLSARFNRWTEMAKSVRA